MSRRACEWLIVRAPGRGDARFEIAGPRVSVGRGEQNDVVLGDAYASAIHVELVEHGDERCVRDLGSTNGTRVNGKRLATGRLRPLRDGDVVQVGSTELIYRAGIPADEYGSTESAAPMPRAGPSTRVDHGHAPRPGPSRPGASANRVAFGLARWTARLVVVAVIAAAAAWLVAPPRVSVLVLGSDARPDEVQRGFVGRTDSMLVLVADRFPPGSALISIPRDLVVEIPGLMADRVNVAYAVGGAAGARRAAGEILGFTPDRYIYIGLQGVREMVDAVGGVDVDVRRPIHDEAYPTDDYGTTVVDIPAGPQHFDGETALRYARSRHQDSDFGRMARQQQVLTAVRDAITRPSNWWRAPAVLRAVQSTTRTDLGPLDLVTLATASLAAPGQPDRLAIEPPLVEERTGAGGAYLLRPTPALRERVSALLDPEHVSVAVLNGSRARGLASRAAERLERAGVRVIRIGDAASPRQESIVEIRPGFWRAGFRVASSLGIASGSVVESTTLPSDTDVRVTLGDQTPR